MLLKQAIEEVLASPRIISAEQGAKEVVEIIDRFLRHNGREQAADALHSEHMP